MLPLASSVKVPLRVSRASTSVGCTVMEGLPVPMVTTSDSTVLLPLLILQYTDMPSNLSLMVSVRLPTLPPPHTVQVSLPASL